MTVYHQGYITDSLKLAVGVQIITDNVLTHFFFRPQL